MINSCSMRSRARRARAVSIPILTISVFLAAIFIASCGDEGDITEDTTGMTDVLQPTTTTPETQIPAPPEDPVVIEEPVVVEEPKASYQDDIQPILAERCATPGCHVAGHFTGLDLSQYDGFKKGGNGGLSFVAGDGEGSLVVKRIDGTIPPQMPLGAPPLNGDEVQLFIDWIDEGGENN